MVFTRAWQQQSPTPKRHLCRVAQQQLGERQSRPTRHYEEINDGFSKLPRFITIALCCRKAAPWRSLVKKSATMRSVGKYEISTSLLSIRYLMMKYRIATCLVRLLVVLLHRARQMVDCLSFTGFAFILWASKKFLVHIDCVKPSLRPITSVQWSSLLLASAWRTWPMLWL